MNFHLVELQSTLEIGEVKLKNVPTNFTFVLSVFYVNSEEEDAKK